MSDKEENSINLIKLPDLPDSVDKALENVTEKPTKELGTTIGDLFHLVFGSWIQHSRVKQDLKESHELEKIQIQYQHELEDFKYEIECQIDKIPASKKIIPKYGYIGNILNKARFCIDEKTLKKMFAKLIAASMDISKVDSVHPSYADIISAISPLDAENLTLISNNGYLPIGTIIVQKTLSSTGMKLTERELSIPIFLGNDKYMSINTHYLQAASLEALQRLGLVNLFDDILFRDQAIMANFYNLELYKKCCEEYKDFLHENEEIVIRDGRVELSVFGKMFFETCCSTT